MLVVFQMLCTLVSVVCIPCDTSGLVKDHDDLLTYGMHMLRLHMALYVLQIAHVLQL